MKLLESFLDQLNAHLVSEVEFSPFPKWGDRNRWGKIAPSITKILLDEGEKYASFDWPSLLATVYMEFKTDGNRSNYEAVYFKRRKALGSLVVAECIEGKGRFLDQIVNGSWLICEETTWTIPAHFRGNFAKLPHKIHSNLDLFAADTGHLLAWIYYLMEEPLLGYAPMLYERMELEIQERILKPYMKYDYGWMGFKGNRVNNWNPWVNSNVLSAALILEENSEQRIEIVQKIIRSLDHFIDGYGDDGGCDEGPGYWFVAGGALLDGLELLKIASGGYIDLSHPPLIQKIGTYIREMHIAGNYYVNFADAGAKLAPKMSVVYRYGEYIHDRGLSRFALSGMDFGAEVGNSGWYWMYRTLGLLFRSHYSQTLKSPGSGVERLPADLFRVFPDTQVVIARESPVPGQGFFLAVKGGHNAESHNHNDVGNFIVYYDGYPVLIDVGVGTYTRKTFGAERYKIWTMQSAYHNLPTVNGTMQQNGKSFGAANFSATDSEGKVTVIMNLEGAYPDAANLESLRREVNLQRTGAPGDGEPPIKSHLVIKDRYHCRSAPEEMRWSLMTWSEPRVVSDEVVMILPNQQKIAIGFPKSITDVIIEPIAVEDKKLGSSWGNRVHRIVFTPKFPPPQGNFLLTIRIKP